MRIATATITNFRNLSHAELTLSPRFTAFVGPNGQGKTNTLEALYFAAALRPLRSAPRSALFREGSDDARVRLLAKRAATGLSHLLEVQLAPGRRKLIRDDKSTTAQRYLGVLVAIAFTPDDLELTKGGPDHRRRFMDRALLNLQPSYLDHAMRYQRALKDRNRLLVDGASDLQLEAYDDVLAKEGLEISRRRRAFVRDLAPRVEDAFSAIAAPAPPLALSLVSRVEAEDSDAYRSALAAARTKDRARKRTTYGPHVDDLQVSLGSAVAKDRASQGQHRALALAMKMAELLFTSERLGEPPVLLLDDMSSELDQVRSRKLFQFVRGLAGQVILTSTSSPGEVAATLDQPPDLVVYQVASGALTETP